MSPSAVAAASAAASGAAIWQQVHTTGPLIPASLCTTQVPAHIKYVGPLTVLEAQPLPSDLAEFVAGACTRTPWSPCTAHLELCDGVFSMTTHMKHVRLRQAGIRGRSQSLVSLRCAAGARDAGVIVVAFGTMLNAAPCTLLALAAAFAALPQVPQQRAPAVYLPPVPVMPIAVMQLRRQQSPSALLDTRCPGLLRAHHGLTGWLGCE
jgi:hypothetical protein